MKLLTTLTMMLLVLLSVPALAATSASTLPNGTPIDVTVDQPVDGTEYVMQPGGVTLNIEGTASVGFGTGGATVVYVLDVSGSVTNDAHADCGGDLNGDSFVNTVLDCEIAGVLALNGAAISSGSVDEVGLAVYGRFGAAADMNPDAGVQLITEPNAGPGDVETVAGSIAALPAQAGPTQYSAFNVSNSQTNFAAGLAAATNIVNASSNETNIVVFLSDGLSNFGGFDFNASLGQLAATGAVVHTYAVGTGSTCAYGSAGTLQQIATTTNGTCTEVEDPSQLAGLLSGLLDSSLDHLELSVDGGAATMIPNEDSTPMLPQDGPVQVTYSTPLAGLGLGAHTMCVTAFGHDGGGAGESGSVCTTVYVYGIELTPMSAVKEVGVDPTHTVTATVGGAGTVGGRLVTFTVINGPNAGTTGTGMTDAGGSTPWTYTNAGAGGTDTIEACFTVADPTGQTGCATATVEWLDTTPPLAACLPGPNPHGSTIPPAGWSSLPGPKGGQNEDGFYDLAASDAVDPNPLVYAVDNGTGHVFGPYPANTVVKWTQAPGTEPSERSMGSTNGRAGAVLWHLTGQGDLLVYAVDASGNASDPLVCLVPPLPK